MYIYVCIYVCMYMYVCMYVYMNVCMYVRMYVCVHVCVYIHIHACTWRRLHTYLYVVHILTGHTLLLVCRIVHSMPSTYKVGVSYWRSSLHTTYHPHTWPWCYHLCHRHSNPPSLWPPKLGSHRLAQSSWTASTLTTSSTACRDLGTKTQLSRA